ncbi:hypothetical protein OKW43_008077 [Paraburkholderia sp. WC7.3g]
MPRNSLPDAGPGVRNLSENLIDLANALAGLASAAAYRAYAGALSARHIAHRAIWDMPHSPWPQPCDSCRPCEGRCCNVRQHVSYVCIPPVYGCGCVAPCKESCDVGHQ